LGLALPAFVLHARNSALRPGVLIAGLEAIFVALLAVQSARLVWILITPSPPISIATPVVRLDSSLVSSNPFATHGAAGAREAGSGDLILFGVRGGDNGTAIIGREGGAQAAYVVGEMIAPGLTLKSLGSDHISIDRDGRSMVLTLARASSPVTAPSLPAYLTAPTRAAESAAASATPAAPHAVDPRKMLAEMGLRPRTVNGEISGYTVLPRGTADTLGQLGIAAGDVVVALNGNRLTPERYGDLEQELQGGSPIQLTVERGSVTRTITLKTNGQ